jgi:hypothetical protein
MRFDDEVDKAKSLASEPLCFAHPIFVPFRGDWVTLVGFEPLKLESDLLELTDTQVVALARLLPASYAARNPRFRSSAEKGIGSRIVNSVRARC